MEKLKQFFDDNHFKPTPWAISNGIAPSVVSRFLNRQGISPQNALRIEQATGGAVTRDELLFPELYPPQADQKVAEHA
jgi:DNA-binding transcriptional regulator YdaS (Cro superfamily)